jgi:hypothetical protein
MTDRKSVPREPAPDQPAAPSLEKWAATKEAWDACEAAPPADDLRLPWCEWCQRYTSIRDAILHGVIHGRAEAAARIEALTNELEQRGLAFQTAQNETLLSLRASEARVRELEADAARMCEALLFAYYCPSEGGYRDGRAVEDTFEDMGRALEAHYKATLPSYVETQQWWSEDEMRAAIDAARAAPTRGEGE